MSFGKTAPDHNRPSFSPDPGCGFNPLIREVGQRGQHQDPRHRPGALAPTNQPRSVGNQAWPEAQLTPTTLLTQSRGSQTEASLQPIQKSRRPHRGAALPLLHQRLRLEPQL